MAASLASTIEIQMEKLLQTPMMICAMYLDQRYHCELIDDPNKIITAKLMLLKLWERVQKIKKQKPKSVESNQLNGSAESMGSNVSDLCEGNIESYLAELDKHYKDKRLQCAAVTVEREREIYQQWCQRSSRLKVLYHLHVQKAANAFSNFDRIIKQNHCTMMSFIN